MVIDKEIRQWVGGLKEDGVSTVVVFGNPISVSVVDHGTKLFLASSVFEGGNYIPQSVRGCLIREAPFGSSYIKTFFKVDENHFSVSLHYVGSLDQLKDAEFRNLLEEFGYLTEEWRLYLDEHDKNDLVHIHAKS